MKYDFTSIMDRHGMDAVAVDGLGKGRGAPAAPKEGFDAIPMWVADMNFPACPTIPEAIIAIPAIITQVAILEEKFTTGTSAERITSGAYP